jgi:MYXO-CTERM domain-containing protein
MKKTLATLTLAILLAACGAASGATVNIPVPNGGFETGDGAGGWNDGGGSTGNMGETIPEWTTWLQSGWGPAWGAADWVPVNSGTYALQNQTPGSVGGWRRVEHTTKSSLTPIAANETYTLSVAVGNRGASGFVFMTGYSNIALIAGGQTVVNQYIGPNHGNTPTAGTYSLFTASFSTDAAGQLGAIAGTDGNIGSDYAIGDMLAGLDLSIRLTAQSTGSKETIDFDDVELVIETQDGAGGGSAPIAEPVGLGLLGLAAVAVRRRRG